MGTRKSASSPPASARVFWSGRSQAVRLPREYRVDVSALLIHREGRRLVLEPPEVELDARGWPRGFWDDPPRIEEELDLGDRGAPSERPDPLGRRSR